MVSTPPSSANSSHNGIQNRLPEEVVQDGFHSYLKSSLTQAKAERLLDEDLLSSAEADLMITGPALCLYFAALRCTTNPPSVPLPKGKGSGKQPMDLSYENCPPAFISFLKVWAKNVSLIQDLTPEYQHDLARVICGLPPICQPVNARLNGIAADLRGVAIEISQRRSFQDRYAAALQAALDAGSGGIGRSPKRASFVPPPMYSIPGPPDPPRTSLESPPLPPRPSLSSQRPLQVDPYLTPPNSATSSTHPRSPSSHSILTIDSPAIEFIRETLYASIADQLERMPSLRRLLTTDPPRAYFGSVAFAILDVSARTLTSDGDFVGVLGKRMTLDECPPTLKPFMIELIGIGLEAKEFEDADTQIAIKLASKGKDIPPTRMDRVKRMLEYGIGVERENDDDPRYSIEGKAVTLANRISGLTLELTNLKAFRDRQDHVFKVLAGIGKS